MAAGKVGGGWQRGAGRGTCALLRRLVLLLLLALAWLAAAPAAFAQASAGAFDHTSTGYPLRGKHEDVRCETCHLRGIFKGTPRECAVCHAAGNNRGALAMPARHIQTTLACDSCHGFSSFTNLIYNHLDALPGGCASCHDNLRAKGKPQNHPSTIAACDQCHNTSGFLPVAARPANHIPTVAGAACSDCHRDPNFSVTPPLSLIHKFAPTTTTGCANCHGANAASFTLPSGFRMVGLPANHIPAGDACESCHTGPGTGSPSLPVADGAKFSGALMNHAGIGGGCADCHRRSDSPASFAGISSIVGMPPTAPPGASAHIPTSAPCEACHLASKPAQPVPASATRSAPGTGFATPAPTSAQIHAGITSGCNGCHEGNLVWMGMGAYPIVPSVIVAGSSYRGFQTRPRAGGGTFSVADPAHPSAGDCSQCHTSTTAFNGVDRPDNHIPFSPSAQCNQCHTSSDYAVMPSLANIHLYAPSTTSNCAQCHGSAAGSFSIPQVGFSIVGLPGNHIPSTASCEVCHVGPGSSITTLPVSDGAKFSGALMSHNGISNNCAACHQPSGSTTAFAGITRIVGMPPTSPAGPGSHIPSGNNCEACHLASLPAAPVPPSATATAPGTGFATPAPTGAMIHAGVTSGCNACHEAGNVWMGMGAYPISPSTLVPGALYNGFQTRPRAAASPFSVADAAHPAGGDCSQCHGSTTAFSAIDKPANHIPYAAAAACDSCHVNPDFGVMPTLAAIHAYAPSTTTNCGQCHGANAGSFSIPGANFSIVGLPSNHIPTTASCEVCHVGAGSSIAALPVGNGAKFSGSLMNHAGITKDCASCHVPAGQSSAFAGITRLIGMPPTSPAGTGSHIPSSTTCEACHLASMPATPVAASATRSVPGSGFATPAPTGPMIHAGITGGCNACHEAGNVWMGMGAYPISPTTITAGASYRGFQTRPRSTIGPFNIADPAHPLAGDCSQCHGSTTAFTAVDRPANHIPFAASAQCNSCHKTTDYAVIPTIADIHANAPSTTGNCALCHGPNAASFAIPRLGFAIVGQPAAHIPTSAPCETCHVGTGSSVPALPVPDGARFANSLMNHAGIAGNCASCHVPAGTTASFTGIARIVTMPPTAPPGAGSHIPSGNTCESCHLASMPSGMIAASATKTAPGTGFATPAPTGAMIHAGITSGCSACHEAGYVWMGVGAYPIVPSTLVPSAQYNGFQTRPRAAASTYGVADPAHPPDGDCVMCHASTTAFSGVDKPVNHIPYAANATCNACHLGTDYSVMPTLAAIHANAPSTTSNCAQCHGANAASFAIPAANFSIVGIPSNHIPTSAACETCHVGEGSSVPTLPVGNGARFSGSTMDHRGITANCATCHQPAGQATAFAGIARIVGMPATSPPGAGSHIPSSTNCEACHLASTPKFAVPASATATAPGTGFATPAPTGGMIHAGITSGCNACHEAGFVWMGVGAYPISPAAITTGAQYKGFQTRPNAAGGTFAVADPAHPAGGDCSQCHGSTAAFTGIDKPANHIPYAAAATCNACHTAGPDFGVMPSITTIHANAPSTTTNCGQCHGANAASFAIPAVGFSIVGLPANHLPTTASCEACHVGPGSSMAALPVVDGAKFSGSLMNHAGITNGCVNCHVPAGQSSAFAGIARVVGMPPTSPVGASSHIPSSTACETCHLASMPSAPVAPSATLTAPGTAFATPAPTGAMIHTGITGGCNACHDSGALWMGVSAYPISPSTLTAGAQYKGFQTRPRSVAGAFNIADPAHPTGGDCVQCHASTTAFTGVDKPANHIPYAATAQCNSCHTSTDYAAMPTLAAIHANAPSTTTNCGQCHGPNAGSFAIPSANFSIVGIPSNHIPTSASCEVCHVGAGSSMAALPVGNGAKFSGSTMSHAGITKDCANCHVPAGTAANFAGISRIVGMPPTSPMGSASHIPSSTTCETCHLASMPSGTVPASATLTAPGTAFATPAPTGPMIHNGVSSGCSACHDAGAVWMGMGAYPITPTVVTANASYKGFQTRPRAVAGPFNVADAGHPAGGDCSQCHISTVAFTGVEAPANHIPYAAGAACTACHLTNDYAVFPTVTAIHANAPSTSANCAQCHGDAAASFAIPANNFAIVGKPADHIPTNASCEVCHVGAGSSMAGTPVLDGARFANSAMNHAGISGGCVSCHAPSGSGLLFAGIARIIGMPPTSPPGPNAHIPSGTACESCHLASMPSGLVPASATRNAPGTAFATPAPTSAQIHTNVNGGCNACHEASYVWMGMGAYPISPATLTSGAQYRGFQTRPTATAGTFNVADAAHPAGGDCGQCHVGTVAFTGVEKPANHIPYASAAACNACHTSPDYAVMPTLAAIHANAPSTTGNCALCHGANAASFAIPAANFSIVGLPSNHLPTSASCEACHVGPGSSVAVLPVGDGAKFSGSLMNHAGITSGCANCHVPAGAPASFAGVTRIVGMPPTSPAGAGAHIPSSTTCESCHLPNTPASPVPASATATAPGTGFGTPAPTGVAIHAGVTGGCNACHDSGLVWMGVGAYPISPAALVPGASYKGFQTRPRAAAGTFNVADPAHPLAGDCSQCHASTVAFSGIDKPANHIPFAASAQCNSCHTASDYAVMPTLANIHANAPSTTSNCAQCHGAAAASYAIPAVNFSIVGLPSNHIPTSASCEVCHVGTGSSIAALPVGDGARFSGSRMSHAGIAGNCAACHQPAGSATAFAGITRIVGMPPTSPAGAGSHIPSSTNCESCHLASMPAGLVPASATATAPGTGFGTPAPSGAQIHSGIAGGCNGCHEAGLVWMGIGAYPISPATLIPGASYRGFQTRPQAVGTATSVADPAHPVGGDCSQCHANTVAFTGIDKPANHIPYNAAAQCSSCHTSPDFAVMPSLANIHAWAPSINGNCAQCHGAAAASFAIPAANFSIVGLPGNHIPTTASCEVCHVGAGSSITALPVGDGARFANSAMNHAGIASNCAACHQPAGSTTAFAGITRIVGMPPTSPAGAGSHIPSTTTCESCHLGSLPAGLIPASATRSAPGTGFQSPAPTGAQIHAGITSGCAACHEAGNIWMGMGAYPIAPAILSPGASYTGFHTRPRAAATATSIADAAHPSIGDCGQCHGNTTAFSGIDKPANHIPTSAAAACDNCHTSPDFAVMPSLANIHAWAPSTTTNCAQCHGANAASFAIPQAGFAIVGLPSNHIPTSTSCEVCHVGAGSSIAALPVTDGARFSGSLMNHAGITKDCASCHVPAGQSSAFAGIARIVGMPPVSPPGAGSHIPSSTICESCHLASTPVGFMAASATKTAPGTAFATPAPTGAMIHAGVTSGCAACHDSGHVWMGVGAYPISPTTLTAGAQYKGFQTRPRATAGTFNVADPAHPTSGDCAQCHGNTTAFTGIDIPANHIPFSAAAQCNSCHTGTDYAVMPTLAAIHANAPSTTSNCAQCHGAAAASFAIPAANFSIVGLPSNHIPTTQPCELCHVGTGSSIASLPVGNGARFSGSKMSHANITSGCSACHVPAGTAANFAGITRISGMPVTSPPGASAHIPSSTTCETCHLGSKPAGLVNASASTSPPGTAWATPAPTGAMIHNGISSGCSTCHDTGYVWLGVSAYPIVPATLGAPGSSYRGFQTRPRAGGGTYAIADAGHPASGDCSLCHTNTSAFQGVNPPANHIPYNAAAACTACHTGTDYAVMPTVAAIHANAQSTTVNCAQCHSAAAAAQYAIPAAGFSIVTLPSNHIPTTQSCEVCHVGAGSSIATTPVGNGARFSGSKMSHANINNNCVSCHVPAGTVVSFAGITRISGMPATTPVGASSHIPSSTTCETCHAQNKPAALVNASAGTTPPGTAWATPAPTGAMIHTNIKSNCNACHDTGYVWMGMGAYPIAPAILTSGAQYKGFQTRPTATGSSFAVRDAAHPASGDCSQCHSLTTYFDGAAKPTGHIPTNSSCALCHVSGSDYSIAGLTTNTAMHANTDLKSQPCRNCHAAGPFAGCATQAACGLPVPVTYQPKLMPLATGSLPTTPSAQTHIPVGTVACELCHSATVYTSFGGMKMKPTTNAINPSHQAVAAATCMSCHEYPYVWYGTPSIQTRIPNKHTSTGRKPPHDCDECHRVEIKFNDRARMRPVMRAAVNAALPRLLPQRLLPPGAEETAATARGFDHRGVAAGQCQSCHNGQLAKARPAKHYGPRLSCDACHRSTAWTPASFTHAPNAAGTCLACHNGVDASARPGPHFVTVRNCDACHTTLAWQPVRYQHLSPAYQPAPDRNRCLSCHVTNGEIIPRQLHGNPRNRPVPVPPKTGP